MAWEKDRERILLIFMIAIIDYGAGNLASVKRALNHLGVDSEITSDPSVAKKAERIIFPGVGASGKAMTNLRRLRLDNALRQAFESGTPILGICLGTQIILEQSQENNTRCLGLIRGDVRRFPEDMKGPNGKNLKVPHMGWNDVSLRRRHLLFDGVDPESEFYFVHSYYPCPANKKHIVGETVHGIRFASVLAGGSLFAVQFHLEKSGKAGLKILSNFCQWDGNVYVEQ
jgi:glutamine amidotransferase